MCWPDTDGHPASFQMEAIMMHTHDTWHTNHAQLKAGARLPGRITWICRRRNACILRARAHSLRPGCSILQRCPETTTQWSTQILEPTKWSRLSENMAPHTKALKGRSRTIPSEATIIVQATGKCALHYAVLTAVEFLREGLDDPTVSHPTSAVLPRNRVHRTEAWKWTKVRILRYQKYSLYCTKVRRTSTSSSTSSGTELAHRRKVSNLSQGVVKGQEWAQSIAQ